MHSIWLLLGDYMVIIRGIKQIINDPWTYYFIAWFVIGAIVYVTGDKWKR